MKSTRIMACGLLALALGAGPVSAQVSEAKQLEPDVPRLSGEQVPSTTIPWAIAAVTCVGVLMLAFKNSKRNSMDQ